MNKDDLNTVIENANRIFEEIRDKYNLIRETDERYEKLKEYLVFSSPYGQCEITSRMRTVAEEFPEMVHDSIYKKEACELVRGIRKLRKEIADTFVRKAKDDLRKKMDEYEKSLAPIAENLEVMEDTFVEIRFMCLDFNIVDELQKDPIISLKHTPQTRTSIRIVFGTLAELKGGRETKRI
jgi:uncharacterized coiled-coil DUF342 family protein